MERIRVLHISDLHLAGIYSTLFAKSYIRNIFQTCDWDALDGIAQFIYDNIDHLDAILISGDISATGLETDLRRALDFFETPTSPISDLPWQNLNQEPTLRVFKDKPIIIVPGNHDRFTLPMGQDLFYSYFLNYWNAGPGGVQSFFIPDSRKPILSIVCADFSIESVLHSTHVLGRFGQGRVYEKRLSDLEKETDSIKANYPSCAIAWMLHFAPDCDNRTIDSHLRLNESSRLIEKARSKKIRYIFCGHIHECCYYSTYDKTIWIHCSGTSSVTYKDDATIHLREFEIINSSINSIKSVDLIWDRDEKSFIEM